VIVLDGCCGAGGATRGYADAGHVVYGADIVPQPNYLRSGAAGFLQADILQLLSGPWIAGVDFIHVSPPCQRHSRMSNCRPGLAATYPDLIGPVRELLEATGLPYVIEQPEGSPLRNPVTLCAWSFGRELYRHRLFEAGGRLTLPQPPHREHSRPASKAGHWKPGTVMSVAGHVGNVALAREVMGIGWSTREELAEAVPPVFTRWIGEQLAGWAARKCDTEVAA